MASGPGEGGEGLHGHVGPFERLDAPDEQHDRRLRIHPDGAPGAGPAARGEQGVVDPGSEQV